jgi:hypothetical protein
MDEIAPMNRSRDRHRRRTLHGHLSPDTSTTGEYRDVAKSAAPYGNLNHRNVRHGCTECG